MEIGVKVGDVMTRALVTVKPTTSVDCCAKKIIAKRASSLLVEGHCSKKRLLGVLTKKDIVWALTKKKDLSKVKAADIMTRKITTIGPGKDIYDALLRMRKRGVDWLPVLVKGGVIGMLTIKDILRIEPSLFDIVSERGLIKPIQQRERLVEGECEECAAYGMLFDIGGSMLCEECKDSL